MRIACVIKKEVTLICEKAQTDSQHILTVRLGEGEVDDVFPFKTLGKKVKAIVCIDGRPHISYEDFLLKILEILWGKEKQDLRLFKENKTKFLNFAQEVREGKFDDEARSHIDKIKKHQKKRREKDAQIAQLRIQQERDEQTLREEYLDTLSLDPNDSASLNGLAKMEVQHGNLEEAESYYQRALRVHKKDALALKGLGDIAYRREDHTKAKSYWIDAMAGLRDETMLNHLNKMLTEDLAKNPKDINILISSGNIWFYQKDLNQAKSFYDRALALDPNNVPALNGLGDVWFNKKDLDQAKTFYARVLVLDPNNVPALNGLGDVWFNKKDLDQAKTFYARVLALDPNNVPALNGFRRCLV